MKQHTHRNAPGLPEGSLRSSLHYRDLRALLQCPRLARGMFTLVANGTARAFHPGVPQGT